MDLNKTINELLPVDGSEDELVEGVIELLKECADRIHGVGEDNLTVMREPVRNAVAKLDEARAACRSVLEALYK